jgi:hypothetical protein
MMRNAKMSWKLVVATPLDVSAVTAVGAADLGVTVSGIRGASVSVSVRICNSETSFAAHSQAPLEVGKAPFVAKAPFEREQNKSVTVDIGYGTDR